MRFHVVALPHTQTTRAFSACGFTEKVRRFCIMMKRNGHEVVLYGGAGNEAPCDEHVVCMAESERLEATKGLGHYSEERFDASQSHWIKFNARVVAAIVERIKPRDFICIAAGDAQRIIADALSGYMTVEIGIGYGGSFSKYRVWESYAWMHLCYGKAAKGLVGSIDGEWFDAVIPGYIEAEEFPAEKKIDDYVLYLGRLIDRKGIHIAIDACRAAGKRLVLAGPGTPPPKTPGVLHLGVVNRDKRANLLARAESLIAPTIYIEPFGNVAIEAQACGTPVISTDWGGFTETVVQGITGYRCRTLSEFAGALQAAHKLDRKLIRTRALSLYSLEATAPLYESYFRRLELLWGKDGWNTLQEEGT